MTTPIQVGLPQIILFLIAISGIALCVSALMGLAGGKAQKEIFEDDHGNQFHRWRRRRRRVHWKRGSGGVVLLVLAVSLLWLTFAVQSYLGLTTDIKAAQVVATKIENQQDIMFVSLTQYDDEGRVTSKKSYSLRGDQWMLGGNMLKFPSWMNMFGIHSGYKLTFLEGRYSDLDKERNEKHDVVELNGGNDDFFKSVYKQAWSSPFVEAAYGNAVFNPADGMTYDIYVSQSGFYAKPANKG